MRSVRREDQTEEHGELSTTDPHATISEEVRARWQKQSEVRRQGQDRLNAYISEGLRKMEEQEVEDKRASQVVAHAEQNEMDISLEERKRQVTKELKEFTREVNKVLDGVSDPDSEESESGNVSVSDEYTTESVWEMDMKAKKARSRQEMDRLKQDKRQRDVERERELERKRELKRLQRAKREQQVVEERGGEQQMNIKAKDRKSVV